uniref:DUF4218 domain-containing protein n=1 Tax=Cajanus cajan TaxID=3821 RepID=A0A151RCC8_CAJCA|nr:hypothetical protein KK1_038547 [Cajanus cajan]
MQHLLPVAIRGILPNIVRSVLTRLCFFFNAICAKVIDLHKLDELENESTIILCQLEMYFPLSFFDIMIHLLVHLVREIRLSGPISLRWMYPVERYMKILKGYNKNPYRLEAFIVERYIAEEAIEFCLDYIKGVTKPVGIHKSRYEDRIEGKGTKGQKVKFILRKELLQAHLYILNNDPIDERWFVVLQGRSVLNLDDSTVKFGESLSFSTCMPTNNEEIEQDDVHATCNDHDEGIWENIII